MNENNQELNQENVEEIFEMEELTETEEKDLTGGASAGKGGYSSYIVNLNNIYPPMDMNNVRITVKHNDGRARLSKHSDGRIEVLFDNRNNRDPYIIFEVCYTGKDSRVHTAEFDVTKGRIRHRGGWTSY